MKPGVQDNADLAHALPYCDQIWQNYQNSSGILVLDESPAFSLRKLEKIRR